MKNPADTILIDGFIYTVDPSLPSVAAVAIRNGRIMACGTTAEIRTYCDQNTQVVDLSGRMVMPGLIDGHCHPTKGAIADLFSCKFEFSATPDEIALAVSASVAKNLPGTCILGGRSDSGFFDTFDIGTPRLWLDQHAGDKAVYLRDDSDHNGWANSKALSLAGIDRFSEDPAGGKIMREPDSGEPTGLLIEQADSLVRNRLPDWTEEQYEAGVAEMVRIAHGYGITGVTDADVNETLLKAYHALDEKGDLQIHVVACISPPYGHRETPLDYDGIELLRDRYASPNVDTRFAKIYLDGVPTAARSAAMLAPYKPIRIIRTTIAVRYM
ncbi:MAG: putative amidohydrolase YtcJ [Gammaproteobacteria bacterium]|jgi:predicted amidohydrolase YtcJ